MIVFICTLVMPMGLAAAVSADIYVWTDADGVKNFTNQAPPEQAVLFMVTPEIDSAAYEIGRDDGADPGAAEDLQADQLRSAQEKINELTEQVQGLRKDLQDALEPVPDQPAPETLEAAGAEDFVRFRTVYGFGRHPLYDPYGYLWHRKIKKNHQRPGYGHGGHKRAVPFKHRIKGHGPGKRMERPVAGAGRHSSGYTTRSHGMVQRPGGSATHRRGGFQSGSRGGQPGRR
jgi:hypothetical protein